MWAMTSESIELMKQRPVLFLIPFLFSSMAQGAIDNKGIISASSYYTPHCPESLILSDDKYLVSANNSALFRALI